MNIKKEKKMKKIEELELKNLEIAKKNSEETNKAIRELRKRKFKNPFPRKPFDGKLLSFMDFEKERKKKRI